MAMQPAVPTIFQQLEVKPVVNARGGYSVLGGSILGPNVWRAMEEANQYFVDMAALLDAAGQYFADAVGAEAAVLTTGASGAIALGTAACLTRDDGEKMARIPDTAGMARDVLIQRQHRYVYDRMFTIVGGRLVEVGDGSGTRREQIIDAIGPDTALIGFPAHLDGVAGSVPLPEVLEIAHERDLPVLVDAAYEVYPTANMRTYAEMGVDVFCFSTKYFSGPNSVGVLCGREHLIRAAAMQGSVGYESRPYRSFFRAFKLDRHMIVAAVVALHEWLATDHEARWREYARKVEVIRGYLTGVPGLTLTPMYFTLEDTLAPAPVNCLRIDVGPGAHRTTREVDAALRARNPAIFVHAYDAMLVVVVETLQNGDEEIVGDGLRRALAE